ncbi:hypothetical protein V8E53_004310 [Lactarius tabidus]
MLSRLSVLFVYLVAGLAASAVATPMIGQSAGHSDGTKQPSRHNYAQKHPYDSGSYSHHGGNSVKACNVDKQYCCDTINKVSEEKTESVLSVLSFAGIFDADAIIGKSCSPFLAGGGGKCEANPVCCDHTQVEGVFAVGCSNFDFDF